MNTYRSCLIVKEQENTIQGGVSAHQPAHAAGSIGRAVWRGAPCFRQPEGVKAAVAGQAAVQVLWTLKGPKGQPAP